MSRKRPCNKGFTLMEGLFSLFIVFMVLGSLAHTLSQAATVKKNTKNMDQAIEEFHALFTMRADVLAALAISSPSEGGTSSTLTLSKINPMLSYSTRIDVLGDPLDPFEAAEQVTVEYRLEDGLLKRFQSAPSAGTTAERLLTCQQMEVSLGAGVPSILEIRLSFDRGRVVKQRSLKVAVNAL